MREDYTIYIHLHPYENEARESELRNSDNRAVRDIQILEETIQTVKEYRKQLFEHTQRVRGLTSHLQLKIKREKNYYNNKVHYFLTIKRVYPDNDKMYQDIISEKYEGTDRFTALKRFDILKK